MIGTIVFVLIFLAVGLGVVLAAMRSGRGPASTSGPSRANRRATGILVGLLIVVVGLGLPALVLAVNADSHAKSGPGGVDLTTAEANGRELFAKNCSTCHTLSGANAVGKVGPNLDELRPPKPLILNAIKNGRAQGRGQMPAELVDGQDAQNVAAFVAAVAGR